MSSPKYDVKEPAFLDHQKHERFSHRAFDIITVGSATLDVFLKTPREIQKHHNTELCYHLGDKIVINNLRMSSGGGGTNTAVAFARLGLHTGFLGVLGNDPQASIIIQELKKENLDFLGKQKLGMTGYSVILASDHDRVILSYKGVNDQLSPQDIPSHLKTSWIYMATMLNKSLSTEKILAHQAKKSGIKVAANMSSYLAQQGLKKLSSFIKLLDVLILNKEELSILTKKSNTEKSLRLLGPHIPLVIMTNGPNSIQVIHHGKIIIKKVPPTKKIVNTTGAGDAFASGVIYGLIKGKPLEKSLEYGIQEAKSVLQHQGAKLGLLRKLKV